MNETIASFYYGLGMISAGLADWAFGGPWISVVIGAAFIVFGLRTHRRRTIRANRD